MRSSERWARQTGLPTGRRVCHSPDPMSGIAGIFYPGVPKPVDPARVAMMSNVLAHRGPDGSGIWTAPGVGFGHRRLSILDLQGGAQPMLSQDERLALTFNGEIYNFRDLRADLERQGHVFRTGSDTEVILAAWRQWGVDCLSRLDGMFAFALFDADRQSLFLARDRLGVKPLFYADLPDGALLFASELKGILAHPLFRRAPSPQAVEDYLALGYVPDDASFVAGVKKLAAGHFLLVQRGRAAARPVCWWDVDFSTSSKASAASLEEELVDHLRRAVRSRMVVDVPLGAFLSGGVDSSAVVAFMAEASRGAVETCSIGFGEADHDGTHYAGLIADRFATSHRSRTGDPDDFDFIDALADIFDEPFADASAIGAYRLSELAREKVKVALSGDGADEAFAGHRRYRSFLSLERARSVLPSPLKGLAATAGNLYPKLDWPPQLLRVRATLQALGRTNGEAYADAISVSNKVTRSKLYRSEFTSSLQGHRAEDRYMEVMKRAPADDALARAQYADLKISLAGNILTKADRTSMAVGLEVREPLLDHRLVEFAARLPAKHRLRRSTGKWLMKKSLERHLPREIIYRREMDDVTPVSAWFRGPLAATADELARSSALTELGWFDEGAIARVAIDHRSGRSDHGRLLWQLLMLDRSLQRIFGLGGSYVASTKYSPSGGALKPRAARSRA